MRKLLLLLCITASAFTAKTQSNDKEMSSLYFRFGTGYGQRLESLPGELDAEGQKHFSKLNRGLNLSFHLGYNLNYYNAFALSYSRLGSNANNTFNNSNWDSYTSTSFVGLTYQKLIPVGEKKDVNFNLQLGPGLIFYRTQYTITNRTTKIVTNKDYSNESLGILTGINFDFRLSRTIRFELNADKTWGKIKDGSTNINLDVLSLGTGFKFSF